MRWRIWVAGINDIRSTNYTAPVKSRNMSRSELWHSNDALDGADNESERQFRVILSSHFLPANKSLIGDPKKYIQA